MFQESKTYLVNRIARKNQEDSAIYFQIKCLITLYNPIAFIASFSQ